MRLPARLSRRNKTAHKGDFGHIFILAGSARFSGAALLCAEAAVRSGAGLVTLGIPAGINRAIIKIKPREVMTLPLPETRQGALSSGGFARIKGFIRAVDVVVIGPGLSQEKPTQVLIRKAVGSVNKPMVIDADGLNALAGHLNILRTRQRPLPAGRQGRRKTILTPHPGEMARLLGISSKEVQADRTGISKKFAAKYKVTLVLKGHNTVVAGYPSGFYVNKTGNPGMATGGSGDVLTGMIAAFLGQGLDAFEAAKYAVYLHGLAGDLASGEKTEISLIASDIIDRLPAAIKISS